MKTLLLTHHDLRAIVRHVGLDALMDQLIERLTDACATHDPERTVTPARTGFHYSTPASGLLEWMPAMRRDEHVMLKVVGYHPDNGRDHDLPTIISTFSLYDPRNGHLVALIDGTLLTAMRTGAASAVASRLLASPDSRVLGLIGCGAQAVTQLHAIGRLFDLDEVLIHDVDPAAVASFAGRVAGFVRPALRISPAPREAIVARADILCTATSVEVGAGPVFEATGAQPWLHVNAVGSDFPGKIEVPLDLLRAALVVPDTLEQALAEGECQQLDPADIGPPLADVARQPAQVEAARSGLTVFDSTGWAVEDYVAAELALGYAAGLGLGRSLDIEMIGEDPHQPYDFLSSDSLASRSRDGGEGR